jgi:hypothetical protein
MAAIQEHLRRHRQEPEAAAHEVAFEEIAADMEVVGGEVGASGGAASAHSLAIDTVVLLHWCPVVLTERRLKSPAPHEG